MVGWGLREDTSQGGGGDCWELSWSLVGIKLEKVGEG